MPQRPYFGHAALASVVKSSSDEARRGLALAGHVLNDASREDGANLMIRGSHRRCVMTGNWNVRASVARAGAAHGGHGGGIASTWRTTSAKSGSPASPEWAPSSKLIVQLGKLPTT
jgi:hypothetical protein